MQWSRALAFLLRRAERRRIGIGEDAASLLRTEFAEGFADGAMLCAEDGSGEKRGIDRAGPANGKRADGMPAGICAMERSESRPFKAFDSTGTPRTGRTVFEQSCLEDVRRRRLRDMTSMPRFRRCSIFEKKIGRAMRGNNACFMWNTEFAKRFGGELHGVQSEPEPMMMPTRDERTI